MSDLKFLFIFTRVYAKILFLEHLQAETTLSLQKISSRNNSKDSFITKSYSDYSIIKFGKAKVSTGPVLVEK